VARPWAFLSGGATARGALGGGEVWHRTTRYGLIQFLLFVDGDHEISFPMPAPLTSVSQPGSENQGDGAVLEAYLHHRCARFCPGKSRRPGSARTFAILF